MKDCKKIHPLLSFYMEEQLSSAEKTQVEKHLGACETARQELESLRRLIEGMRKMPEPRVPSDLHAKIMGRLGGNVRPLHPHRGFWGPATWALSAAAVFVFIFLNQFPSWRDTAKVQKPKVVKDEFAPQPNAPVAGPQTSTNTFTATNAKKAPVKAASGYYNEQDKNKDANAGLNFKKSMSDNKSEEIQKNRGISAGVLGSKSADTNETLGLANEAPPAETSSAPRMARSAKNKKAALAAASAPSAPPPQPAPAVESMDQSVKSLTYSREQEVQSWNGNNGPVTAEQGELVTDVETFQKYWRVSHPAEVLPAVDFAKEAVVVLMAGEKPTAGYSILVSRLEEKADQLVIHYRVDSPAPGAVTAQIITHPWAMQIIPKPAKPIVFTKDP